MSKKYQVKEKGILTFAGIMIAWLVFVLFTITPIFREWGTVWWINASGIALVLVTAAVLVVSSRSFLRTSSLKLELDSVGLRERNWGRSWLLPWGEVAGWCAIEVGEGEEQERSIRLKSVARAEPFDINPVLLDGKQFAEIYREIEKHCGTPRPGAELLGENDGEPFQDVRI
jgi:hypothetical protein